MCHDFYRQQNSGLIYQQARRNTFSQPMCRGMEDPPIVPKPSSCHQDLSYPWQIQCFGRQVIDNRQNSQNRVGIGSIDSKFNFPNVQLSQSGSVSDTFQSQTSTYVSPVLDNQAFAIDAFFLYKYLLLLNGIYLSWVLVCLQKAPYEPLHKASKLHVTLKTAFLLALATAKRCSKIHALAMDSNHLRFSQSDGSVSLTVQTGFLAKNQPSICPDPILIPNLACICKRNICLLVWLPWQQKSPIDMRGKWLNCILSITIEVM